MHIPDTAFLRFPLPVYRTPIHAATRNMAWLPSSRAAAEYLFTGWGGWRSSVKGSRMRLSKKRREQRQQTEPMQSTNTKERRRQ